MTLYPFQFSGMIPLVSWWTRARWWFVCFFPAINTFKRLVSRDFGNVLRRCCGPALVQCGSGSSFWSQCGSGYGSGSWKPKQCGSRRMRIRVRLLNNKKLNFYMKNILKVGNCVYSPTLLFRTGYSKLKFLHNLTIFRVGTFYSKLFVIFKLDLFWLFEVIFLPPEVIATTSSRSVRTAANNFSPKFTSRSKNLHWDLNEEQWSDTYAHNSFSRIRTSTVNVNLDPKH